METLQCRCLKQFARKDALKRHERTCYTLKEMQCEDLRRELEEAKQTIMKLGGEISTYNIDNRNGVNMNMNMTNCNIGNKSVTNIIVNAFGKESLDHIRPDDVLALAEDPVTCISEFTKMVHSVPENKTICCSNVKDSIYHVTDENGCFTIPIDKNRLLEKMYIMNKQRFFNVGKSAIAMEKNESADIIRKEEMEENEDIIAEKERTQEILNTLQRKALQEVPPHDVGERIKHLRKEWEEENGPVFRKRQPKRKRGDEIKRKEARLEKASVYHDNAERGVGITVAPKQCDTERLLGYKCLKKEQLPIMREALVATTRSRAAL